MKKSRLASQMHYDSTNHSRTLGQVVLVHCSNATLGRLKEGPRSGTTFQGCFYASYLCEKEGERELRARLGRMIRMNDLQNGIVTINKSL